MQYVGHSSNIKRRIDRHNAGTGAEWTNFSGSGWKLVKAYPGNNDEVENAIAMAVIRNEGFANVRGGCYSQPYYDRDQFRSIKMRHGFTNNGTRYYD